MKRARAWEVQVISKPHSTLLRVWLVGFNSDRRHHISGVHVCLAGRCLCSCCDRVQSQGTPLHEPKPSSAPARYTCFCGAAWPRYACFTARCEFIITHTSAHNPGTITLVHTAPHKRAYDFAINRLAKMRRHSNAPLTPWAQSGCCSNNNNKIKNKHGYAGQLNSCTHLRALLVPLMGPGLYSLSPLYLKPVLIVGKFVRVCVCLSVCPQVSRMSLYFFDIYVNL